MDDLGPEEAVDRPGGGVVEGVSDTGDRGLDVGFRQALGGADADMLRVPVDMMHQATTMNGPLFVWDLFESIENEARLGRPPYPRVNNPVDVGVNHEDDVDTWETVRDWPDEFAQWTNSRRTKPEWLDQMLT